MGKNGKKQNAFVFFCTEKKQTMPEFRGMGMAELATDQRISNMWTSLTAVERFAYVEMAKEYNNDHIMHHPTGDGADVSGRFDCMGNSLLAKKQEEEMIKYRHEVMLEDMTRRLQQHRREESLSSMRIHILHINFWLEDEDFFAPAEIGLVEMTIEEGVRHVLSQKVCPDVIPKGFKGEIKAYSDKYHKLWMDNKELSDDYDGILRVMADFLKCREGETAADEGVTIDPYDPLIEPLLAEARELKDISEYKRMLPVYVMPKLKQKCEKALKWLMEQTDVFYDFSLYDLDCLFFKLIETETELLKQIPTTTLAEAHLGRDVFLFTRGVLCDYHDKAECSICAPAIALRHAFVVCDFTLQIFDIRPIEGGHVPYDCLNHNRGDDGHLNGGNNLSMLLNSTLDFNTTNNASEPGAFGNSRRGQEQAAPRHELHFVLANGTTSAARDRLPEPFTVLSMRELLDKYHGGEPDTRATPTEVSEAWSIEFDTTSFRTGTEADYTLDTDFEV